MGKCQRFCSPTTRKTEKFTNLEVSARRATTVECAYALIKPMRTNRNPLDTFGLKLFIKMFIFVLIYLVHFCLDLSENFPGNQLFRNPQHLCDLFSAL